VTTALSGSIDNYNN